MDSSNSSNSNLLFPYNLDEFVFERILDENPNFHFSIVLGTLPDLSSTTLLETRNEDETHDAARSSIASDSTRVAQRLPAILRIERTAFSSTFTDYLSTSGFVSSTKRIGHTDIYSWSHAWLARKDDVPDAKVTVIFPATEVHIRKYTKQERVMVSETPDLYCKIVKPYIDAFPPSRTQWVKDILEGRAETETILCRTPHFLIIPDMKWDPAGPISSLYLLAIATDASIRSLRDLRGGPDSHVRMLEDIREVACRIAKDKWELPRGALRMYVHYQPSYYHFHVHIVHASQDGTMGMTVGQAHLLEDIISMLKYSPNILSELTFTYGLGSQHGLYDAMVAAQVGAEQTEQERNDLEKKTERILKAFA